MSIRVRLVVSRPRGLEASGFIVRNLFAEENGGVLLGRESSFDLVLTLLVAAMALAACAVAANLTYTTAIISLVVLGAISVVLAGASGIRWGFIFWITTLGIGYRTVAITPLLKVHPSELVLWGLLLWLLIWAALNRKMRAAIGLPAWLWMLLPFCVWGWMVGEHNGLTWDRMLAEMKTFLLLVPLCVLASTVLAQTRQWRFAVWTFVLIATAIATLGLTEYFYPGIANLFPAFIADPEASETMEGFARARFSFWGGPAATYACILAVPFALPLWRWTTSFFARVVVCAAVVLLLAGVYAGGYRVFWLLFAMQSLLFLALSKRYVLLAVFALAAIAGYQKLPDTTKERIHSLVQILRGQPTDTSGVKHLARPRAAIELCLSNPTGTGWGAAGWVHSDFIQVAANLGIFPGLLFFGGYLLALLKLGLRLRLGSNRPGLMLDAALLLSLLTAG